jgi:hypothetical protein
MFLVRNERVKLIATYLNGAAIAAIAVGGISQAVNGAGALSLASITGIAIWIVISLALHLAAQAVFGRLRE